MDPYLNFRNFDKNLTTVESLNGLSFFIPLQIIVSSPRNTTLLSPSHQWVPPPLSSPPQNEILCSRVFDFTLQSQDISRQLVIERCSSVALARGSPSRWLWPPALSRWLSAVTSATVAAYCCLARAASCSSFPTPRGPSPRGVFLAPPRRFPELRRDRGCDLRRRRGS